MNPILFLCLFCLMTVWWDRQFFYSKFAENVNRWNLQNKCAKRVFSAFIIKLIRVCHLSLGYGGEGIWCYGLSSGLVVSDMSVRDSMQWSRRRRHFFWHPATCSCFFHLAFIKKIYFFQESLLISQRFCDSPKIILWILIGLAFSFSPSGD